VRRWVVKALIRSALGLVLVLGWWTFTGNSISTQKAQDTIPSSVFGGGAAKVEIEAETTTAARMMVGFSDESGERNLESYEDVPAGTYRWAIDVPSQIGGYVELNAVAPKAGDRIKFRILANGRTVFEDQDELLQPLEPGYAFFVQAYLEDYAKGELSDE
jgi:hypothetical protein